MSSPSTILLIDDDNRLLNALERQLVGEGYEVWAAISAAEASAILERYHVDLVICDNRMPGSSGLEFMGRIKGQFPHMKRIILSGTVSENQAFQAVSAFGIVDRVLAKPCQYDDLKAVIEELLGAAVDAE